MLKISLSFLLSCLCVFVFAQLPNGPQIIKPSPTAAELGSYGDDTKVGQFTGAANVNIPLYTVKTKNLTLPIELNYTSNGFKVEQMATNVGMNWSLNAGGVISRTVHDKPDPFRRIQPPADRAQPSQELYDYLNNANHSDTQPDVFNFNFGQYSGKFIFDDDGTPLLLSHQAVKIVFQNNVFSIVTPDGVTYTFAATETSYSEGQCAPEGKSFNVITAWYLTEIKHPLGDIISFVYTDNNYAYYSGLSQTITKLVMNVSCTNGGNIDDPQESCVNYADQTCYSYTTVIGKELSRINIGNTGYITFQNSNREDLTGNSRIDMLSIYSYPSNQLLKQVNLSYFYSTSFASQYDNGKRLFLSGITEQSAGLAAKSYALNYYDTSSLPNRFSFSQDQLGYYNGISNTYFATKVNDPAYPSVGADRSPNSLFSVKGMLKSVKYPTGAENTISYEANTVNVTEFTGAQTESLIMNLQGVGKTVSKELTNTVVVSNDQTVTVNYKASLRAGAADEQATAINFDVYNSSTGQYVIQNQTIDNLNIAYQKTVDLKSGVYKIVLRCRASTDITAGVRFDYLSDLGSFKKFNKEMSGLRVAKITSSENSGIINTKKYYYASLDSLDVSSGIGVSFLTEQKRFGTELACKSGLTCFYTQIGSNSVYTSLTGNSVLYASVIEGQGDNFENGGTESHYIVDQDQLSGQLLGVARPLFSPLSNSGYKSGLNTFQRYFKKGASGYETLKTIEDDYTDDARKARKITAYTVQKNYEPKSPPGPLMSRAYFPFELSEYKIYSSWVYKSHSKTTDYSSPAQPIVTEENYYYDNPLHAQLSRTVKTSSKGKILVSQITYPDDYAPGTAFLDNMKANHIVAAGIENVSYFNDGTANVSAGQINEYTANGNLERKYILRLGELVPLGNFKFSGVSIGQAPQDFAPQAYSKDSHYEQRFSYLYNTKNNLVSVIKDGSTQASYLWGYNNEYPVLEIKSTSYPTIESILGSANIESFGNSFPDKTAIDNFVAPLKSSLPGNHISIYTYNPLIGVMSQTDEKGKTTSFDYDDFQRLKTIKDQNGNLIKSYQYHYRN